jgi:4-diphosphocytidyl-2-C-methyl-D-erythritol kinase
MIELLAPAKVNLTLRILGKRPDGFHELESLVCPISVFDRLTVAHREEPGIAFHCDDTTLPGDDTNLAVKAARLFCESCGLQPNLTLTLAKQIPHGAGLGGGSSDAASVLLGLDALFETRLPTEALSLMAADLGSDVPLFLYRSAAIMRGRGEKVEPVRDLPELPLLLIKPPFGVPTPSAYKHWSTSRELPGIPYGEQRFDWGSLVNDLERPVFEKHLFLATLKRWLLEQPEVAGALMSGSGSTTFAVLRQRELGYPLGERLAQEFGTDLWCYLCETLPG